MKKKIALVITAAMLASCLLSSCGNKSAAINGTSGGEQVGIEDYFKSNTVLLYNGKEADRNANVVIYLIENGAVTSVKSEDIGKNLGELSKMKDSDIIKLVKDQSEKDNKDMEDAVNELSSYSKDPDGLIHKYVSDSEIAGSSSLKTFMSGDELSLIDYTEGEGEPLPIIETLEDKVAKGMDKAGVSKYLSGLFGKGDYTFSDTFTYNDYLAQLSARLSKIKIVKNDQTSRMSIVVDQSGNSTVKESLYYFPKYQFNTQQPIALHFETVSLVDLTSVYDSSYQVITSSSSYFYLRDGNLCNDKADSSSVYVCNGNTLECDPSFYSVTTNTSSNAVEGIDSTEF